MLEAAQPAVDAEQRLGLVLDQLALAQHFVEYDFDSKEHGEAPRRDYDELRRLAAQAFPDFGYYNVALPLLEEIGNAQCGVGDAIDDLADIARDLYDVAWRWSNTSVDDALFHFQHGFRAHWRDHVRGLQLYLAARAGAEAPR
ncbi:MAG TPA: hypothetical protein VJV78_38705 [Polyangiales bacterium]|nr:hypothetical protein [Polyangiales bacterium]